MKDESLRIGMEELGREVAQELATWRREHPKATLYEIELAVEHVTARAKARMLEQLAAAAEEAEVSAALCPHCGGPTQPKGREPRHLKAGGEAEVVLERQRFWCRTCQVGFSPPR